MGQALRRMGLAGLIVMVLSACGGAQPATSTPAAAPPWAPTGGDGSPAVATVAAAAPAVPAPVVEGRSGRFSGSLSVEPASTSTASYCRGGSELYLLMTDSEQLVLNSHRDPLADSQGANFAAMEEQLAALAGSNVVVEGMLVSKEFSEDEHCPDKMMQCISGPVTCSWVRVESIQAQ